MNAIKAVFRFFTAVVQSEGFAFFAFITIFFIGFVICVSTIVYAGNSWECSSYSRASGERTKMITLTCYVRESDRWVTLESHTTQHHVDVNQ